MARTPKSVTRTDNEGQDVTSLPAVQSCAPVSKIARVIAMLERSRGATLADMVESTGWLPHTTRAALTGLRKKGHAIAKESRDGVSVYKIGQAGR